MSVYNYRKYKISLQPDSKKTQGLRTGDIVRRQYFDGENLIYSLMCVLSYGKEEVVNSDTNEIVERAYFIGALLEGNVPASDEILDFARITNLFDDKRSGALYLTGSDEQSPYMDVIDGIGQNASLCYPSSLATVDYADAETQYMVCGVVDADYLPSMDEQCRVVHIKRQDVVDYNFIGIQQDFYKYVENPNRVLISYKVKSSRPINCKMSLGYQDGTRIDGEETYQIGTDWQYKLHAVTIDYSGRYLRTLKLDLSAMKSDDEVWIADFNMILLSSITNFNDASKIRIGKLDGISDPVFGQLDGYGSYIQKLFASKSAHISGTLTAGDENGFAATFYAGKIHRNCFVNSIDVDFLSAVAIDTDIENPTGIGNVYRFVGAATMKAQSNEWLIAHVGKTYTISFWACTHQACQLSVSQNTKLIRTFDIPEIDVATWRRYKVTFDLQSPIQAEGLELTITQIAGANDAQIYFVAPRLSQAIP